MKVIETAKTEVQALLATHALEVVQAYCNALRECGDMAELRKGVEFLVKTLNLAVEREANAHLPVVNIHFDGAVLGVAPRPPSPAAEVVEAVESAQVATVQALPPAPLLAPVEPMTAERADAVAEALVAELPPELFGLGDDDA